MARRSAQPSLWDDPPAPPPNVDGVPVCTGRCGRDTGFTRDTRGWWVCGGCRRPTAGWFAAVRPDRAPS